MPVDEEVTQAQRKTARLFFALWPDATAKNLLDEAGKKLYVVCGGRRTRADHIHITLLFLGDVEVDRVGELLGLAAQVKGCAFDLNFTKLGWWRRNRVAWATSENVPQALTDLVNQLQLLLKPVGFQFDERPFLPHATLLRKANCRHAAIPTDPIPWKVREFALVKSVMGEEGSTYEIMGRWPLL